MVKTFNDMIWSRKIVSFSLTLHIGQKRHQMRSTGTTNNTKKCYNDWIVILWVTINLVPEKLVDNRYFAQK